MLQVGKFAAFQHIARYRDDRGANLSTFLTPRVRGAMIDELRAMDWVPRLERAKGVENEPSFTSLAAIASNHDGRINRDETYASTIADPRGEDPVKPFRDAEGFNSLLVGCSKRERLLLIGYYAEGMTMKQVGAQIGLSETRVSQVHEKILVRIRKIMKARESVV